ncbi:LysR family transcriptional regulator [Paraburkholderia bryophila]|uniref:DNA-binding transcriptional LysR family regulator n=1 Tax=Paraburkholderia bryophila TaxID=420952 RepID=A0A7Y9WEK2_9BURK|nr:LysR family transcriptional regulator [Paraburkholderia bryophila]NYH19419.1 DNA-binding transcriptional LysR family regulator [Paraburkholderia bryophila]
MTDLNSLIIFAKVVEANSFSEAARRLNMPISTVSRRVADLEDQLGVRLLERSTRNLRVTEVGADVLEHAQRSVEVSDAVDGIVSNQLSSVTGSLRLSAPPSVSDSLLAPLVCAFQSSYPDVRVQIFVTDRFVDHISEGVDLVFRIGELKDSTLVARKILTYRQQLLASPDYLAQSGFPETPQDLLAHRLLAFSNWRVDKRWDFTHVEDRRSETLTFVPHLSMNDFTGIASAMLSGAGIGHLPPIVQPELLRDGRLVEVMPKWRFRALDLSMVRLGNRHISRPVRLFEEFAMQMALVLFPTIPS